MGEMSHRWKFKTRLWLVRTCAAGCEHFSKFYKITTVSTSIKWSSGLLHGEMMVFKFEIMFDFLTIHNSLNMAISPHDVPSFFELILDS